MGNNNTAMGAIALKVNSTGTGNTAVGFQALSNTVSSNFNTAVGKDALLNSLNGSGNTAIGESALLSLVAGSNNIAIGKSADVGNATISNATVIGDFAFVDNSDAVVLGNSAVTTWAFGLSAVANGNALQVGFNSTNGNGARLTSGGVWTNASDSAKKEEITKLDGASILEKVNQLPVTSWKYKGTNEYHIGPMAQDFYNLFKVGVDDKSISSLDPAGIALRAIQEQQKQIDFLKQQISLMTTAIEKLKKH
jgi:hypothetical protein